MKYTPIGDKVLVKVDIPATYYDADGLLVRPDTGREMPLYGTVRAIGPGRDRKGGGRIPCSVAPGDRVVIPWAVGVELFFGGVRHRELRDSEILMVDDG